MSKVNGIVPKEIYATSKVRISVQEKEDGQKIFRILVDHNGHNVHANIPEMEAAKISEAIYSELSDETINSLAN